MLEALIDRHTNAIEEITGRIEVVNPFRVPGSNEAAGRVKSTRTRPGNPYLQGALGTRRNNPSNVTGSEVAYAVLSAVAAGGASGAAPAM